MRAFSSALYMCIRHCRPNIQGDLSIFYSPLNTRNTNGKYTPDSRMYIFNLICPALFVSAYEFPPH